MDNALTGAAGVFHVAMMLSLRGMIALPTIRNTAGYDIIVSSRDGSQHANIQVKTAGGPARFWPICKNISAVKDNPSDYYVLLRRPHPDKPAEFEGFMLTGTEMKRELEEYIAEAAEKGQRAGENFPLCVYASQDKDDAWKNRWRVWTLEDGKDRNLAATA